MPVSTARQTLLAEQPQPGGNVAKPGLGIIRAEPKAKFGACRQHEDGYKQSLVADAPRHINAVDVGCGAGQCLMISAPAERGRTPQGEPLIEVLRHAASITLDLPLDRLGSFAYRFDTADGSVTISGDTNKNDNLIALAKGSDVLIHEVMDKNWAINLFPAKRSPDQEAKLGHLLRAHTPTEDIGPIAQAAGVKMVVLTHFGPPNLPDEQWLKNMHGFDGQVKLGKPLMSIGMPLTK